MKNKWKLVFSAYAVIAVATFGHAAASRDRADQAEYRECLRRAERVNMTCFNNRYGGLVGLLAAPLWPLYWSWEAWS